MGVVVVYVVVVVMKAVTCPSRNITTTNDGGKKKKKKKKKKIFVARKTAESNFWSSRKDEDEEEKEDEEDEEDEDEDEDEEESRAFDDEEENTDDEEDEEEGEERKKSRFQFRWETVRLSWKRLVETFYENNNNNNNEKNENNKENEGERLPGKLFVAVPGRVWMINNEDGSDSESSSASSSDEDEDEDAEDAEEKALRKTREDCAKFSKEVINRIVFGVAWKKVHESISHGRGDGGDGNKNSTISWSKYNRDPLETMNTDEYEEDVYERDLHAKARFDRRWPLVNRVNWLHSFRKIVSKFRDEVFLGVGSGEEGEKKNARDALQKALAEDAVFRDAAMQATRKWPLPVEGEEKAFPMYDEWAEIEERKTKGEEVGLAKIDEDVKLVVAENEEKTLLKQVVKHSKDKSDAAPPEKEHNSGGNGMTGNTVAASTTTTTTTLAPPIGKRRGAGTKNQTMKKRKTTDTSASTKVETQKVINETTSGHAQGEKEVEVITGKIELKHLVKGMFVEIDSGDPNDPWWGEIYEKRLTRECPRDHVYIKYIVQNPRGEYEYFQQGRQFDIIGIWSIKECGYHLPCASVLNKQRKKRKKKPSMHRAEEKKKGEETASVDVSKQPQLKEETITATPLPSTTETTLAAEAAETTATTTGIEEKA